MALPPSEEMFAPKMALDSVVEETVGEESVGVEVVNDGVNVISSHPKLSLLDPPG
jgi:hypothetical protein